MKLQIYDTIVSGITSISSRQMLTICQIQRGIAYSFHRFPTALQKTTFWRAKGNLLEGKRSCFTC